MKRSGRFALSCLCCICNSQTIIKVNELGHGPPVTRAAFRSLRPGCHESCQMLVGPEELVSPFWQWDDAPRWESHPHSTTRTPWSPVPERRVSSSGDRVEIAGIF